MQPGKALIKFLVNNGILKEAPDASVLDGADEYPLWALARHGLIDEHKALEALEKSLSVDIVDLDDGAASEKFSIATLATSVNPKICWQSRILPLYFEGERVVVAVANPFAREALETLEFILGKTVLPVLALESQIVSRLATHYPQSQIELGRGGKDNEVKIVSGQEGVQELDQLNTEAPPIIRLTNKILADAIKLDASDIHIEPNRANLVVRFRIDGVLQNIVSIPKQLERNVIARIKILGGMDITERRRPQDGRIRVSLSGQEVDLRVSSVPASSSEKIVLRLLKSNYESLSFKKLFIPDDISERLDEALHRKGKLLLVTGPTGSGKTTTLYTALNTLRDGRKNITTIEDPVEYRFEHINQIQVNTAANVTFASVLRAVLRQDPDIVMVGEVRDGETVKIVLQAAQTGHLVLSTAHTNDAPSAVTRLLELGADPYVLASALRGILAQRLVRVLCEECASPVQESELKNYERLLKRYDVDPSALRYGKGCTHCLYSGYRGRRGVYSFFEITEEIADLIHEAASMEEIVEVAKQGSYQPLDEAAIELLRSGVTSYEEVRPYLSTEEERAKHEKRSQAHMPVPEVRIMVDRKGMIHTGEHHESGRAKVLIIDDNQSVRKMIGTLLKREMVEVSEAENGLKGMEQVYQSSPDLILCDIQMPEMDGKAFLSKMKGAERTRDIPIIMLTVDDCDENEAEFLGMGAREFLSKRGSPLVLVSRIRRVLDSL